MNSKKKKQNSLIREINHKDCILFESMYKEISRTGRFTETENREVVTQGMAEMWGVEAEGQSYLLEAVNRLYI